MNKVLLPDAAEFNLILNSCIKQERLRKACNILQTADHKHMNLVYPKDKADEDEEEVVLHLQGYVVQKHLPPILTNKQ